jgi:acyl transferase domain-containing protein
VTGASSPETRIAIVGMACRVPGASNLEAFWNNVIRAADGITALSEDELRRSGVPQFLSRQPGYVPKGGFVDGEDLFDAELFGLTPREAALLDPQHRLLLECAWEGLEHAGIAASARQSRVGVYVGVANSTYLDRHTAPSIDAIDPAAGYQALISGGRDFAATRLSYQLDLSGPSVNVQTACSTSLVAVHMACQALINGECDIAIAGGAAVRLPQRVGYVYEEGLILSRDGRCRPFDAQANGTVIGNGAGIVVLKRLDDADASADLVHAVILGSAVNNDGAQKVGYTAPSVTGQAGVIVEAQALAGVPPSSIGYVEAHGTGTPVGDPIEVAALTTAFRRRGAATATCALGSVKSNIGHLDIAAGVVGLIKTVLAVREGIIPPTAHFSSPNPALQLETSPFYVPSSAVRWPAALTGPRRAGVSAFGIGGTNAHVVLEQAPEREASGATRRWQVLPLSARTTAALRELSTRVADHLALSDGSVADSAFTLACGRRAEPARRAVIARTSADASDALRLPLVPMPMLPGRRTAWLFPGQGSQQAGMGELLAKQEPVFRAAVEDAVEALRAAGATDVRQVMWPEVRTPGAGEMLTRTAAAQASLFAIEYGLSALWRSWGVEPAVVIGHSVGEFAAACATGMLTLDDAARLVAARGRMMEALPGGAMLAVAVAEANVAPLLRGDLWLSVVNAPDYSVVGGTFDAVARLEQELATRGIAARRLNTSHAFHTGLMEPMLAGFAIEAARVQARPPSVPWISTLTGTWQAAAPDADYWVRQVREPVRFAAAVRTLFDAGQQHALLELGPGDTLKNLAGLQATDDTVLCGSCGPHVDEEPKHLATAVASLWASGVAIDWKRYFQHERRNRVAMPAYPFQRERHWVDAPVAASIEPRLMAPSIMSGPASSGELYTQSWQRLAPLAAADAVSGRWLICLDEFGVGAALAGRLRALGATVVIASKAAAYHVLSADHYQVHPSSTADFKRLLNETRPDRIVHLWTLTASLDTAVDIRALAYDSVLAIGQAMASAASPVTFVVVSNDTHAVTGDEQLCADKALLTGPVLVLSQEHPELRCRNVDLQSVADAGERIDLLLAECAADDAPPIVAHRGRHRWTRAFVQLGAAPARPLLRSGGAYLITGGLGRIGLAVARHLHASVGARLVLVGRSTMPPAAEWASRAAQLDEVVTVDIDHLPSADDERMAFALRELADLKRQGADVIVLSADVSDERQMRDAFAQAEAHCGAVDGVFHAAGAPANESFAPIEEIDAAARTRHFAPKVTGVDVLRRVLAQRPVDFCVLMSSLSSVLGGLGFAAYAAANAYMDGVALQADDQLGVRWLSVGWDAWRFDVASHHPSSPGDRIPAIEPDRGVVLLERALSTGFGGQVLVSTSDLQTRANRSTAAVVDATAASPTAAGGVTETVMAIWRQLLGVDAIHPDDDFYALGGNSLIATQAASRLRRAFNLEISVRVLFEETTPAQLARYIDRARAERGANRARGTA